MRKILITELIKLTVGKCKIVMYFLMNIIFHVSASFEWKLTV